MIRLGVIGYGRRIHGVINNSLRSIDPELRVTAVVDPDKERRAPTHGPPQ